MGRGEPRRALHRASSPPGRVGCAGCAEFHCSFAHSFQGCTAPGPCGLVRDLHKHGRRVGRARVRAENCVRNCRAGAETMRFEAACEARVPRAPKDMTGT